MADLFENNETKVKQNEVTSILQDRRAPQRREFGRATGVRGRVRDTRRVIC